jgi:YggT family protein
MFPGAGFIQILIQILILLLIVRAIFSWFPQMLYSEAGRIIVMATEWYLAPIRRVIPSAGGLDLSFLVGIILLYALQAFIGTANIAVALLVIVRSALIVCIIQMDPWHPITQMVMQVSEPFARPFRQWFPRRPREFDWAPVAAFVVLLAALVLVSTLAGFLGIG